MCAATLQHALGQPLATRLIPPARTAICELGVWTAKDRRERRTSRSFDTPPIECRNFELFKQSQSEYRMAFVLLDPFKSTNKLDIVPEGDVEDSVTLSTIDIKRSGGRRRVMESRDYRRTKGDGAMIKIHSQQRGRCQATFHITLA